MTKFGILDLKLLLKSKYFRNRTTLRYQHCLPTKVPVAHTDEKPFFFLPNLALQEQKKWIFGQIWNYLIWPNKARDSCSTHDQYLITTTNYKTASSLVWEGTMLHSTRILKLRFMIKWSLWKFFCNTLILWPVICIIRLDHFTSETNWWKMAYDCPRKLFFNIYLHF